MTALTLLLLLGAFVLLNCEDLKTKKELNNLFNSPVRTAEQVVRPKKAMHDGARSYFTTHSGVRVTLEDGRAYLIHKGRNYGLGGSDTVVTDAAMSPRWRVKKTHDVGGRVTVGDLTAAAGTKYRVVGSNCHDATRKMRKTIERAQRGGSRRRSG